MSYKFLQQKDLQSVVDRTGCLAPCTFLEYRITKSVEVVSKTFILFYVNLRGEIQTGPILSIGSNKGVGGSSKILKDIIC